MELTRIGLNNGPHSFQPQEKNSIKSTDSTVLQDDYVSSQKAINLLLTQVQDSVNFLFHYRIVPNAMLQMNIARTQSKTGNIAGARISLYKVRLFLLQEGNNGVKLLIKFTKNVIL